MHNQRATFQSEELAVILSYFDIGVIESVTELNRGSRRSPKIGIVSNQGKFLLKRRSTQKAHPDRVRFAHRIQQHLACAGFPVARLVETRETQGTFLQWKGHVYELFSYVAGQPYKRTTAEASSAADMLARLHESLTSIELPDSVTVPKGDYHDASSVRTGLQGIAATLSSHDSFTGTESDLDAMISSLSESYDNAAGEVRSAGIDTLPSQIIHADWHPGNMLFRNNQVVAVIDFDASRESKRIVEVANGVHQFSITGNGDPATWPAEIDRERFGSFLAAYEKCLPLSDEERSAIPGLMIQALIAECVAPIRLTGSVGRWAGFRVLNMVIKKIDWIHENGAKLM